MCLVFCLISYSHEGKESRMFYWLKYYMNFVCLTLLLFQFDGFQKEAIQMVKPAKGTTTLAFIFKEAVMVAADSRASMDGYTCMLYFCSFFFDLLNNYRFWMQIFVPIEFHCRN